VQFTPDELVTNEISNNNNMDVKNMNMNQKVLIKYWDRLKESDVFQEMLDEFRSMAGSLNECPTISLPLCEEMEEYQRKETEEY